VQLQLGWVPQKGLPRKNLWTPVLIITENYRQLPKTTENLPKTWVIITALWFRVRLRVFIGFIVGCFRV